MNFIRSIIDNIKYTRLLNKVYTNENLLNNLSNLFGFKFKKDWIGRLYTVINPNILNKEEQIYEYNENGLDNEMFVEKFIMDKLNIADNFIKTNNLFDLLTYRIEKIDNYGNYLFILQPITLYDCLKSLKKILKITPIIILFIITLLIIF